MTSLAAFVDRYRDTTPPTPRRAWSDFLRRAFLPSLGLWLVVAGLGLLIVGPLNGLEGEAAANAWLQEGRTPLLDDATYVVSKLGNTSAMFVVCVLVGALLWWRTREWWVAVLPVMALTLEQYIFLTATTLVGRGRPDVALDEAPPTSGYPSGHVGASVAFYVTFALLAQHIRRPVLRWAITAVCLLMPVLTVFARLYRGMHHPSDVVVGALTGLTCVVLAWRYLRRDEPQDDGGRTAADAGQAAGQTRAYLARAKE